MAYLKGYTRLKKIAVVLCVVTALSLIAIGAITKTFAQQALPAHSSAKWLSACDKAPVGYASCDALVSTATTTSLSANVVTNTKKVAVTPKGYYPADLQAAYALAAAAKANGNGQTVAIVDAYNDPRAGADLSVYRAQFKLPPCTTTNGCFKQVNQNGLTSKYPANNGGWSQEISLDLDMVSAICPNCHILLVEANSPGFANLAAAVNTAVKLGATEISNSYGGSESSSETTYAAAYTHAGIAITASAGDNGYGPQVPAAYAGVTAVGGTSLNRASGSTRGWSETAWSGTGSGCSAYIAKPTWQSDSKCSKRSIADVSAVADPNTGVAVYDSYAYQGMKGWLVFGGTSVSSPIIASVYALAGNAQSSNINGASYVYAHVTGNLNDITSGSNGSCGNTYLCQAGPGYDGPTGLGTPNGIGAF